MMDGIYLFISILYALAGMLCGWILIRPLTTKSTYLTAGMACITHILSTVIAFFVFPECVSILCYFLPCDPRDPRRSWEVAFYLSFFSGLPSAMADLVILRLLFNVPISRKTFLTVWLWKGLALLICLILVAIYTFGFHGFDS